MEAILQKLAFLPHWKIDLLVIATLLQGAVVAVFPEEAVITALGVLLARNRVSFPEAVLSVQIGLLPANAALFCVGRKFGKSVLGWRPVRVLFGVRAIIGARRAFRTSGNAIIAITRFTPLVRGPVYLAAGLSRLPYKQFLAWDAGASLVQIPLLLGVGALLGRNGSILDAYRKIGIAMVVILIGGLAAKAAKALLDARKEV